MIGVGGVTVTHILN